MLESDKFPPLPFFVSSNENFATASFGSLANEASRRTSDSDFCGGKVGADSAFATASFGALATETSRGTSNSDSFGGNLGMDSAMNLSSDASCGTISVSGIDACFLVCSTLASSCIPASDAPCSI